MSAPKSAADPSSSALTQKRAKDRGVVSTSNYRPAPQESALECPLARLGGSAPSRVFAARLPPLHPRLKRNHGDSPRYAGRFEQWGIDEAFLDVTDKVKDFTEAEALARQIKQEIKQREGLTASIGVGPNKLIAKVASDFQKPDGLTVVREEEAEFFLAPLPVRKLLWVGKKTEAKLKA